MTAVSLERNSYIGRNLAKEISNKLEVGTLQLGYRAAHTKSCTVHQI